METAIITGAAKGLGRDMAIALAKEGYKVAINYRTSVAEAQNTEKELQSYMAECFASQGDVTDSAYVAQFVSEVVKKFGGVGVLINNIGDFLELKGFLDASEQDLDYMISSNFKTAWNMNKEVFPLMQKQGYGRIINFGALGLGHDITPPNSTPYHMAKKMVSMMTKRLAKDAPEGVTINQINPTALKSAAYAPEDVELLPHSAIISVVSTIINGSENGAHYDVGEWEPEE